MKVLVEVSQGIGNCVQGTPVCHALWLLGHEVDLFVHRPDGGAEAVAELWHDWPVLGRVFTRRDKLDARSYDFGVSCYGKHLLERLFPPGLCISVVRTSTHYQSETEANVQVARWLGYAGDTPPSHVGRSARRFDLGSRAVTVHAGCAHFAQEKRWPYWGEVCRRLKAAGWRVVLVGTPSDRSAENWEQAYDSYFDLGLRDLNALLHEATIHLGNDSGVGHLAAAAGLPGLTLYGPTSPVKNAPNCRAMRRLAAPRHEEEEYELTAAKPVPIRRLTLEAVWAEIESILASPGREQPRDLPARATATAKAYHAALQALEGMSARPPVNPAVHMGPATANSLGEVYDELEHRRSKLCAANVLAIGAGQLTRAQAARRTGEIDLKLAAAVPQGVAKARHKAQVHARVAFRAGLWSAGTAAWLRAAFTR